MSNKVGVFIGRFQPPHDGHRKCIEHILKENDKCIVLMRDTIHSSRNPLTLSERRSMFRKWFVDPWQVIFSSLPDNDEELSVYFGRDVGYKLIRLDPETESISATRIRDGKIS